VYDLPPSLFKKSYEPGINSQDFLKSDGGRSYTKGDKGNINIRGLEGNRILTQIDGVTIPRFNYGNSSFSVSRLNFIDFNTIGKLEVLKGSGSSLYGSDAIGGVVSLKSIRPDDLLKPGEKYSFEIPANYSGANDSTNGSIKFAFRENDFEAIVVTSKGSSNELNRKTDDKYIDDYESDSKGLYTKIIKKLGEQTEFGITFENYQKESESSTKPENLTGNYISADSEGDSERTRISFDFDYASNKDSNFDLIKGSLYFNEMDYENNYKERTQSGGTDNFHDLEQDTLGGNLQVSNEMMVGDPRHLITYGFEASKFNGSRTSRDYSQNSQGVYELDAGYPQKTVPETDVNKYGIYFQNEVSLGDLEIIGGIRYDHYDLDSIKDDDCV
jgi:hemoglobin/transferrin/lactoferrin receptor protein